MRGPLLFAAVLGAAAAAWFLAIRPIQAESLALAAAEEGPAPGPSSPDPASDLLPRLDAALESLRPGAEPAPPRPPLREESPGVLVGRLRGAEVQDLLAWTTSLQDPPTLLELRAAAGLPDSIDCRVVLARGERR